VPPLTDPARLMAYRDALGNWNVRDYIQFELTEEAHRWGSSGARQYDPEGNRATYA
jgi:hypothetical protein